MLIYFIVEAFSYLKANLRMPHTEVWQLGG